LGKFDPVLGHEVFVAAVAGVEIEAMKHSLINLTLHTRVLAQQITQIFIPLSYLDRVAREGALINRNTY
jgi:hypothetical protein